MSIGQDMAGKSHRPWLSVPGFYVFDHLHGRQHSPNSPRKQNDDEEAVVDIMCQEAGLTSRIREGWFPVTFAAYLGLTRPSQAAFGRPVLHWYT